MKLFNSTIKKFIALALVGVFAISNVACGADSIEKSIGTFTRAVKSARQVTTEQHEYGQISDEQYASRLKAFRSVYVSVDTLGDSLVKFGEINNTNRAEILNNVREVNKGITQLINSGDLGIKDPARKAEFNKWVLLASGTLSSIEVAIAASKKTVPVNVELPKLDQE